MSEKLPGFGVTGGTQVVFPADFRGVFAEASRAERCCIGNEFVAV
jgi:hypothetical protein